MVEGEECGWTTLCWGNVPEELEEELAGPYLHSWAQQVDAEWGLYKGMMVAGSAWLGRVLVPSWGEVEGGWMGRWG